MKAKTAAMIMGLILCLGVGSAVFSLADGPAMRTLGPPRAMAQAQRLAVNTGGGPALVVRADRADGEAQLMALADSAGLEEGWAFIPAENLWIEIAGGERRDGMKTYHVLDDTVYYLLKKYDDIAIYHIHPRSHFRSDIDGPFQQLQWTVGEALPSYQDMAVMINLSGFFRNHHPKGHIAWRLVSRHGITSYGLSELAVSRKAVVPLKQFSYRALDRDDDAQWLNDTGALLEPQAAGEAVNRVIRGCASRLGDDMVWVRFSSAPGAVD